MQAEKKKFTVEDHSKFHSTAILLYQPIHTKSSLTAISIFRAEFYSLLRFVRHRKKEAGETDQLEAEIEATIAPVMDGYIQLAVLSAAPLGEVENPYGDLRDAVVVDKIPSVSDLVAARGGGVLSEEAGGQRRPE